MQRIPGEVQKHSSRLIFALRKFLLLALRQFQRRTIYPSSKLASQNSDTVTVMLPIEDLASLAVKAVSRGSDHILHLRNLLRSISDPDVVLPHSTWVPFEVQLDVDCPHDEHIDANDKSHADKGG